jgi:hypothetical protein
MIMTICSKFGTRDWGAAVEAGEGTKVGRAGVGANVGERMVDGMTVGGALVVQEINSTKRRIYRPRRFI